MGATSINVGKFSIDSVGSDKTLLTARPDIRIVKLGFLAAVLIAVAGIVVYLLPISESAKVAFMPLGVLFIATLAYCAILYEGLATAVYTVSKEYVEEQGGVFWKTQHRVPLSYVRDVSYGQNFLQAMFGVSSVTISPTNGNKIVLSNISDGSATREAIWKLVLSESPSQRRQT